jgi:S-adenosylmethionine:diacylglycerol 3-amino-3-carboxypropyl transferase
MSASIPERPLQEQKTRAETAWETGRILRARPTKQLQFGQMYEDCERIEGRYFPKGSRVFSIASAGDTAILLAADHHVTAVDINPSQVDYAARRAQGAPAERGAAERLLARGRRIFPLMGWDRQLLDFFLTLEDPNEQLAFWHRRFNTPRSRAGIDVMFSPLLLRTVYSRRFLDVLPEHFGRVLWQRLERTWAVHPNRTNPYVRSLLIGEAAPARRSLRALDLQFAIADAANYLEASRRGSFDAFTFSNILDGASPAFRQRLFAATRRAASADAVVVLRSFSQPTGFEFNNAAVEDRSPLWGVVDVRPVKTLPEEL